jgi:hypothetical protein
LKEKVELMKAKEEEILKRAFEAEQKHQVAHSSTLWLTNIRDRCLPSV